MVKGEDFDLQIQEIAIRKSSTIEKQNWPPSAPLRLQLLLLQSVPDRQPFYPYLGSQFHNLFL
jgi:hypothetical protein